MEGSWETGGLRLGGGLTGEGRSSTIVLDLGSLRAGKLPLSKLRSLLTSRSLVKLALLARVGAVCRLLLLRASALLKPKLVRTF